MKYDKELTFAKELAHEAGTIMRRYFRAEDIGTEWKSDDTPLTVADTKINRMVIDRVKEVFPSHSVIGEEESYENGGDYVWVVDPIDGTIPFSLGIPLSVFSLALVSKVDGQSQAAVVYDPQLDHLYSAVRGQGAQLNGYKINVSKATGFKRNYFSVLGNVKFLKGAYVDAVLKQGGDCLVIQSQVYSASKVASGEIAGSIFEYGSPWDSAAASLLVEEAGGVVTDMNGKMRRYDEWGDGCILAANKTLHGKILKIVKATKRENSGH